MIGMCRREFWIAYCWIVLYCWAQPWPVLSAGLSVPPERMEPGWFWISTVCMQTGCSGAGLPPAFLRSPPARALGSRRLPTTIRSLRPILSLSVILPRRASTRVRIAVALSGGVDSSVAAALLRRDGHEVVGVTLQQWPRGDEEETARHGGCCSLSAVEDARRVASLLQVPYYVWNLEREFGERVIEPFHRAYREGRTPNPCLRCNAHVRFDLMLRRVLDLGFEALATGHYARVVDGPDGLELHAAADPAKDQSYVLYHLDGERLAHIRFPLGELTKPEI